ncbi:hypothetical protein [Oscillibacter sp.]|uniref:hypothetical protein n=1 Tax=Oscillibacter sp. TaxID=1945593 RepID=UPI0033939B72
MSNHDFNFEHGEILGRIGASWYVSYAYNKYYDPSHDNFKRVGSWKSRASNYNSSLELEKYFMEQIVAMSSEKLSTNRIGLSGNEVLQMARVVLARL